MPVAWAGGLRRTLLAELVARLEARFVPTSRFIWTRFLIRRAARRGRFAAERRRFRNATRNRDRSGFPTLEPLEPRLALATFEVTSLVDDASSGTLRWAITQANALAGADVITFSPSLSGTILLTSNLPNITESVTVTGPGQSVITIDGNNSSRPFTLDFGSQSATVLTVSDLTLRRGGSGGLIWNKRATVNATRLTIADTTVSGSYRGAVSTNEGGSVSTYTDCVFRNNSVGIGSDHGGNPTQVSNNDADYPNRTYVVRGLFENNARGLWTARFVRIDDSTFRDNTHTAAALDGNSRVQVWNSTFENNTRAISHTQGVPTSWTSLGTNHRLHVDNTFRTNGTAFVLNDAWNATPPGRSQRWTTLTNNDWDGIGTWITASRYDGTANVTDTVLTQNTPIADYQGFPWIETGSTLTPPPNAAPTDIALSASSVAENQPSGTAVGNLSTTDADAGDAFTYTLVSGTGDTDNASFQIVGGQLQTNASFDYELQNSYTIRVRTTDQGNLTYEKQFTITVTDVNEAPTAVVLTNTTTSIAENTSTTTRIKVADIVVTDDALGSESITLTGADAASFEVDGLALYLKSGVTLDYETKASYAVTVNITDTSLTGSTPVTVNYALNVTDVNEAPTAVALANTTTSLPENTSTTARIKVADILVTDDALGSESITLTGADAASFEVDGLALYLKSGVTLDYETKAAYAVTLNVADTSLTGSTPVTVNYTLTVTDVNEVPTAVALANTTTSLPENTSTAARLKVADILVTDDALGSESITLTGADAASFEVDGLALYLKSGVTLDFEAKASYAVTMNVADTSLTGSTPVTINYTLTVTDANEAPTAVALANTTTSLPENTSTATRIKVADIVVTDDALGSEAITLTGADAASFEVDGLALYLKSGVTLDFDVKSSYAVTVNVADTSLTGSTPVTVSLTLTLIDMNTAPVGFDDTGIAVEAGGVANALGGTLATGNLLANDTDNENDPLTVTAIRLGAVEGAGTAGTLGQPLVGTYGSLTVLASGAFTYTVADTNPAVQALRPGDVLTESFNYTVTDGSVLDVAVLVITIRGSNDTPTVTAVLRSITDTIADDRLADATGTLTGSDVDAGATRTWGIQGVQPSLGIATRQGLFGTLSVNVATGAYVYRPDARAINALAADATDAFTITADDGVSAGTAAFSVAIAGTPDTPSVFSVSEDTGASTTDRLTNVLVITVMGAADPGTTVLVHGTVGGQSAVVGSATASAEGLFTVATSPLADGVHAIEIESVADGRTSGPVMLGDWTVDTVAPATPAITTPDTSGGLVSGTAEAGSTVSITVAPQNGFAGATYAVTADADGRWAIDITSMPPVRGAAVPVPGGPFTLTAAARDRAGNTSAPSAAQSIRFDDSAPRITSPAVSGLLRPTISGTAPARQTVRISIDGTVVGETTVSRDGTWSFTVPTDLAAGTRAIRVAVVVGSSERAATIQSLLIDRTPPAVPAITSPASIATGTPLVRGTAPAGTTVTLSIRRAGQAAATVYTTSVADDGTWGVEFGRMIPASGVLRTLADGEYDLSATATSPAGLVSAAVIGRLTVDTTAPTQPVITSSGTSTSGTPVFSGQAEPGSTVRLRIGEAVYEAIVGVDGTWSIDLATATTLAGTHVTLPGGIHEVRLLTVDPSGNASPEALQLLRIASPVANEPPAVLASANSFSGVLTARDVAEGVTSVFALAGVADGTTATLAINDRTYTTQVADSAATFTIPEADLVRLPQGNVAFTFSVGSTGITFSGSFVVDTLGPSRPTFGSITSTPSDPTPADQFTAVRRPTVVIRGEPGQTVVLRGPDGIVAPSRYSVVESPAGTYTITLLDDLPTGDYFGILADARGNENSNRGGVPAQNAFRIDSVPILYDRPESRQAGDDRVYGVLGILNRLDGAEFPVAPNADGTWTDLDGERLTMGIVGGAARSADGRVIETSIAIDGARLSVLADTGSYVYVPFAGSARIDRFPLYLRDASGNQTQFILSFDSRDFLDRDGISEVVETRLAGATGDRNADGVPDARQNSVTTLVWGTEADFAAATDTTATAPVDRRTVSTIVVNTRPLFTGAGRTFSSLAGLMADVDPLAQLLDIGVVAPQGISAASAATGEFTGGGWDAMRYTVEALASRGLLDLIPDRPGTQIQVSFDISAAGISTRGGANGALGFNAARKFVSAGTIEAYAAAGLALVDFDGNTITQPGWLDFTARDATGDGIPDTDGVIFIDFQSPGEPGHGTVDAVVVMLTDNAFGDDDPTLERVVDPFLAGAANNKPRLAPASARYTNTPAFDLFRASTGRLEANDADGDRLSYGIVGGSVRQGFSVRTSPLGTLRVNTATGAYTYTPKPKALNSARPDAVDEFMTTVSDGSSTTQSTFRVQVAPAVSSALPATFRLGSLAPENPANVLTDLPDRSGAGAAPSVSVRQQYIEFTLEGATADVRRSDLALYSNDRLISLRKTRLVKVAEEGGRTTYRLLGIRHASSARATFTFAVNGPGGGAATTWKRA